MRSAAGHCAAGADVGKARDYWRGGAAFRITSARAGVPDATRLVAPALRFAFLCTSDGAKGHVMRQWIAAIALA